MKTYPVLDRLTMFILMFAVNSGCTVSPHPAATTTFPLETVSAKTPIASPTPFRFIPADQILAWKKYIHEESKISFEYPEACLDLTKYSTADHVWIACDFMNFYGMFSIQKLASEEVETINNPPQFSKEERFVIVWQKPIQSPDFSGWEYIFTQFPEPVITPSPEADLSKYFNITFIDKTNKLRLNFYTGFDYESFQIASQNGFDEIVSSRYSVFEYMARSLRYDN
jgi:hypothetical protein